MVIDRILDLFGLKRSSQYAAAKTTIGSGGWSVADSKVNTVLANSLPQMRARARQLVRDMPAMAAAVTRIEEFTVGEGVTMQSRIKGEDGKLIKPLNQKIEDAWNFWCDEADESGLLHFSEMTQLCARNEVEVGEYVAIKRLSKNKGKYIPFSLLMMEPDDIAMYGGKELPNNEINQGVEFVPSTGRPVAYHFQNYERRKDPLRIPADKVVIGYKSERPGQLRGVTPLAPVILLAHSLRDYLSAELEGAQKAAKWLAFITSPDPAATMSAFGGAASSTYTDSAGNAQYTQEVGNAVIDYLRTGETVTVANHNRPGDNFEAFVRFILRAFAAAAGVTYELVSGDYYDAKYTAARVSRNDMLAGIRTRRRRLIRNWCSPVYNEFMDWAVVTGKLDLPNYFSNKPHYQKAVWLGPGMESLDPLREGKAEAEAIANKTRSPQEILLSRGRDPEQVLDEIEEWETMLKERGLEPEEISTAMQTNPAAQGAAEEGKAMRRVK